MQASARETASERAVHVAEKMFSVSREDLLEAQAGLDKLLHFRYRHACISLDCAYILHLVLLVGCGKLARARKF